MADIQPFCGIRYRCAGEELPLLLAPPYDVISPQEQQQLYDSHLHNVVRLILGKDKPDDDAQENKYLRAARYLRDWQQARILVPDDSPCLYLYGEEFMDPTGQSRHRIGIVAAVRLEEFSEGGVRPHENTHLEARQDRLQLMRACRCNLSSIFSLCQDPSKMVNTLIERDASEPPVATAKDCSDITHRLWQIHDPARIREYQDALGTLPLYLADGHHRYETSLNYRREQRAVSTNWTGDEAANFTLMTIVDVDHPGLVIWPTHRLIRNASFPSLDPSFPSLAPSFPSLAPSLPSLAPSLPSLAPSLPSLAPSLPSLAGIRSALEPFFRVAAISAEENLEEVFPREHHTMVLVTRDGLLRLELPDLEAIRRWLPEGTDEALHGLDVTILHSFVLEGILAGANLLPQYDVAYTADPAEALEKVRAGEAQCAFLLPPPDVRQVLAVAAAGGRMPPKSTFFYPKLITGMVMRSLESGQ